MKRVSNIYPQISNFNNIVSMTDKVCKTVRNKNKVDCFETFKTKHIYRICKRLHNKDFKIGKYNNRLNTSISNKLINLEKILF